MIVMPVSVQDCRERTVSEMREESHLRDKL